MREINVYEPEQRRDALNNLYCHVCGNTNLFQIDLRLQHIVEYQDGRLTVGLDKGRTDKVVSAIEKNISQVLDRSLCGRRPVLHCANCHNGELDMHEYSLETCYNIGCPGCFDCGNWIEEETLREWCRECIINNNGCVDEEYCFSLCPNSDYGLEQVMQHYNITLEDLIKEAGF